MATRDYTLDQPVLDTLEQALREAPLLGRPAVGGVFRPTQIQEVSALLRAADGFGGKVCVGAEPVPGCVALDLGGLDAVVELDAASQLVHVGAGATPAAIAEAAAAQGLELDLGWFADPSAPLGHALAAGEAAPAVFSVRAVLPDGATFETPRAPRRASGPAPDGLLVGGAHAFGVIVGATLRLREVDPDAAWYQLRGPDALERVRLLARAGVRWRSAALRCVAEATGKGKRAKAPVFEAWLRLSVAARAAVPDAQASDAPPPPPQGRPVWRRWSALPAQAWAGPLDLHGGWAREAGSATSPASDWLERARRAVDPRSTLSRGTP